MWPMALPRCEHISSDLTFFVLGWGKSMLFFFLGGRIFWVSHGDSNWS
jgi:hypothetical protein